MAAERLLGAKSLIDWLRDGHGTDLVMAALALLLPPLVVLAPLGTAPLLLSGTAAAILLSAGTIARGLPGLTVIAVLLTALGLWGATSALWSIIPGHSFFEGVRFLGESAF